MGEKDARTRMGRGQTHGQIGMRRKKKLLQNKVTQCTQKEQNTHTVPRITKDTSHREKRKEMQVCITNACLCTLPTVEGGGEHVHRSGGMAKA